MRLFKNGKIASETGPGLREADVLVDERGRIERVAAGLEAPEGAETVDCAGCVLAPGMFDLHVHAREPGDEHKETLATCAAAALHGGVTGLVLMPDISPPVDTGNLVKSVQDLVAEVSPVPMWQAGCLTKGMAGEELAAYSGMAARGVPLLSDGDREVPCPALLRRCMEYARDFDLLVATRPDTPALTRGGAVNEGRLSYRLGLPGAPAVSEEIALERDLRLARYTGARLHLQQVSTAEGLLAVRRAKEDGAEVSCEVSHHHLLLSEEDIADYDAAFKLHPPLRLPRDAESLLQGLLDDTVDAVASDHAPHTEFEKSADFGSAPAGATGLETVVLSLHDRFIRSGAFGWDLLVRKYSSGPRRVAGLPPAAVEEGAQADFFVFDPAGETCVTPEHLRSKSPVTPFLGRTFAGAFRGTALGAAWFAAEG